MKKPQLRLWMLCLLFLPGLMLAQEAVSSSGGNADGTGGSASFTVGQVAYQSTTTSSGTVAQGVQQAFEIYFPTDIDQVGLNIDLSVYPNPTMGQLLLEVDTDQFKDLHFQLITLQGQFISSKAISQHQTILDLSDQASGAYLIQIKREARLLQSIKIIKH